MGKRELVLIAAFVLVGIAVYQVTAPPAPPGSSLSIGGIFQRMRRGVQGARETAEADSRQIVPVPAGTTMLRVNLPRSSDVTIKASDRQDLAIEMRASSRGFDRDEAKAAAETAKVTVQPSGDAIVVSGGWNDRRGPAGFVTQVTMTLSIPRRLKVVLQPHIGLLTVTDVAGLECLSSRGETHVTGTTGDVQLGHVGGPLEIKGAASLKLTSRNSRGDVSQIAGATRIEAFGSRLSITDLSGTLDIDSRNADLSIDRIGALQGPFRYNGTGGGLRVAGLRSETRIDGHNTDVNVSLAAPAPVTIYNLGAITVTAPPGGYTLDAAASEGRISIDEPGITPSEGADSRAGGRIRGGGPALTLRATRGRIDIRAAATAGK